MSELRDLYQEVILDHYKRPRNFRPMDAPDRSAEGYNPLCGDKVAVFVRLEGDALAEVTFQGSGCAISTASASLMTEALTGRSTREVHELFSRFQALVTGGDAGDLDELGKLAVFEGVRDYPTRIKCAILVWHAIEAAMQKSQAPVTTE